MTHFAGRDDLRPAEPPAAGEQVVGGQPGPVERLLPPAVTGQNEREIADDVRGVPPQPAALLECIENKLNVPLPQVAHAAVDELGTPARRAAAEVAALGEQNRVPPAGGIDRDPGPGRPAADDDDVPRPDPVAGTGKRLGAVHGDR